MRYAALFFLSSFFIAIAFTFPADACGGDSSAKPPGITVAELVPGNKFDSKIEAPKQFFGFQLGTRHLLHHQVASYARHLADTSEHVRLVPYAESHGGRELYVLLVTRDADNLSLDELEKRRRELASGKWESEDYTAQKTLAYVGYCVHGDEASGINAFPAIAYYLAAGSDPLRNSTLDRSVILLDPCLNPDGSDRFANWVNENRGRFPSDNARAREHSQPFPGGRSNYYWFDLNRDWLPTAHPESRGRIELFHRMKPNVVLDFHEMGSTSSYFFQPGIPERNNPLTPENVFKLTKKFAAEHAKALDAANELYFTEERFDDFYMGKGSTYPDLHGAIGILFEQGSSRGLLSRNERYTRSFADTVANQIRTTLSSLQALENAHDELLEHQRDFFAQAIEMAENSPTRAFVMHADGDSSRISAAAELLRRHDIEVWIPSETITVDGRQFSTGSVLVVPVEQPEYRFIESLMQKQQNFRENIFYDVSAWTLPFAFDLETIELQSDIPDAWKKQADENVKSTEQATNEGEPSKTLAYAIDPTSLDAPKVVAKLMRAGFEIRVAYDPFQAEDHQGQRQDFVRGTWILAKPTNVELWSSVGEVLATATLDTDVQPVALRSGLSPTGSDLGSDSNRVVPHANVLLVVGEGTSYLDSGSIWHFLDHRFELPATLVNAENLDSVDLDSFTCIVLPGGNFSTISQSALGKLKDYVSDGGTIVAVKSAIRWLQSNGLVAKSETLPPDQMQAMGEIEQPKRFADASDASALERVAGAIFAASLDITHPLAFGFPDATVPVFRESTVRYPVPANYLTTAAKYESVLAGYVSPRNRERLTDTASVWAENRGSGRIICIADNPVFRGYFRGSERFLTNAILLGPTFRIPSLVD